MNINYPEILAEVQGQDNNTNSDSEAEESEPPPCSIKHKEAIDVLDKCLTWLHQPEAASQNTHLVSLRELAAQKMSFI